MKTNSPDPDVDARVQPSTTIAHIKAIASRADLLSTLQVLRPIAKPARSLPVISGVMIVARGDSLKITADNGEIMARLEVPAKIDSEGAVVLSAERLVRLLTYAAGDELKIDVKDGQSADLVCSGISAHLSGRPASDFVQRADPQAELTFQIPLADLKAALAWISAAISMPGDQARHGIHFFGDGRGLKIEALNGHTLHSTFIETSASLDVVGPPSIINLVHALAGEGECTVATNSRTIRFTAGKTVVCAQLLDGVFPDTSTVIPQPSSNLITLPKDALVRAINASLSVMDKKLALSALNLSVKRRHDDLHRSVRNRVRSRCHRDTEFSRIRFSNRSAETLNVSQTDPKERGRNSMRRSTEVRLYSSRQLSCGHCTYATANTLKS